jgi:uncharacterized RDD family membrane protein YckC
MERVGFGKRFPTAILDGIFLVVLIAIGMTVFATVGGARLLLDAQRALGAELTWNSVATEQFWDRYEARSEELVRDIERQISEDFTDEQADFIGRTLGEYMESYFVPENLSLQFFLDIDEEYLDRMVDEAFDEVIAAGRSDISAADVNALRGEVKNAMDEFAVGTLVPRAINFAIWLALLPTLIVLVYGLVEGVFGRSLGKMATGIAVRRENGERAYAGATMLRYAVKNSPFLLVILGLLVRSPGVLVAAGVAFAVVLIGAFPMFGPERRTVYDYISGTAVFTIPRGEHWS